MIGDTDFFIDLMHAGRPRHADALARVEDLEARGVRMAMTAVTRFELAAGVEQYARPREEQERIQALLRTYPTYPVDGASADRAGRILGALRARGVSIGAADALIAGVVLERDESLLTRNRKDFSRVEGLRLETY